MQNCQRKKINESKHSLSKTYQKVEAEELQRMVHQVERAGETARHSESWKLVNEITGRKRGRKVI